MGVLSPQWPTREAIERLNSLFGLVPQWGDEWDQDWELEAADATRVAEFCDAYEAQVLDKDGRFALMLLIVASYDDYLNSQAADESDVKLKERIRDLLSRNFVLHQHTIAYWTCYDTADDFNDPDQMFAVTPLMRLIWNEYEKT